MRTGKHCYPHLITQVTQGIAGIRSYDTQSSWISALSLLSRLDEKCVGLFGGNPVRSLADLIASDLWRPGLLLPQFPSISLIASP